MLLPPHGQARSVWIVFGRPVAHDDASVCDVFPSLGGNVCFGNEEKGVSAFDLAGHALGESSYFVAVRLLPSLAVFWVAYEMAIFHEFASFFIQDCRQDLFGESSRR